VNLNPGYTLALDTDTWPSGGDKWHECGTATVTATTAAPITTTLYADTKSDFNYFKTNDKIKIGTDSTEYTVASVASDSKSLTITGPISSTGTVKYYGKRILIDFNNATYKGADDKATKCLRKTWATANEIKWDGVSNYNKCG